jgi:flagellar hook-associated protein 1 FlgK
MTQVNALHSSGYDLDGAAGGAFFTGSTAATISVAVTDPRAVAASSVPPSAGDASLDSSVADALGGLGARGAGPDAVFRSLVNELGIASATLTDRLSTQSSIATNADNARMSVSGVSVDEELTSILTNQRSYEAAGRLMTAVDSMLDTLINRTGLVGRG